MQTSAIYYSKKKAIIDMLKTLVGMAFGIFLMLDGANERKRYLGLIVISISGYICWNTYRKRFKNGEAIITFSDQGIQTEEAFIEWKFIKNISFDKNSDSDNKYPELIIEYTDAETLEMYEEEKKEIESGAYQLRQEERYKQSLGMQSFKSFDHEEEANKTFEAPTEITPPEIITEAEMYYDETYINFEDADQTEEEIRMIISDFKKKINKKLPPGSD